MPKPKFQGIFKARHPNGAPPNLEIGGSLGFGTREFGIFAEGVISVCNKNPGSEIVARSGRHAAPAHMGVDLPETTSRIDGPLVKQFSVFLPNKVGAMLDVAKLLNAHHTHIVAMSVAESTDAAIARIIVSDPEQVEDLFRQNDIAFGICTVVVVELREVATQLVKLLATLFMAEVNVHFSYPLLTRPRGMAALALHVDDTECASSVLLGAGFKILSQSEISR
jgi:hypothetical protein